MSVFIQNPFLFSSLSQLAPHRYNIAIHTVRFFAEPPPYNIAIHTVRFRLLLLFFFLRVRMFLFIIKLALSVLLCSSEVKYGRN